MIRNFLRIGIIGSICFLLITLAIRLQGQDFQLYPATLTSFANGGMNWGDYNNDGTLDIVFNGNLENGTSATKLFKNRNGQFTEVSANLPALYGGSSAWGDFDNDNDLDLLVCGTNPAGDGKTLLYRNNGGLFVLVNSNLTGLATGEAIWLDYDNDGNLDILLTGDSSYNTPVTKLYRNTGSGRFSNVSSGLFDAQFSFVAAGDYDNDGKTDILLGGECDTGYVTRLFRNVDGIFEDTGIPLDAVGYGDGVFIDNDHDGDLDIVLMGATITSEYVVKLYRNEGDGQFTSVPNPMEGEWAGHMDVADINSDGNPDLGITGSLCCGDALTRLYMNNGAGNFILAADTAFPDLYFSQINFGDFDNDGDVDFMLTGIPPDGPGTTYAGVFRNQGSSNSFTLNSAPTVPAGLRADVQGQEVILHWNASSDNTTPVPALTYNVMVGTSPDSLDIMAPLSDPLTGFNKVFSRGNCGQLTFHELKGLSIGIYYWSVQALDLTGAASDFSRADTFEIRTTGTGNKLQETSAVRVCPNPAIGTLNITADEGWKDAGFFLFDATGTPVRQNKLDKKLTICDVSGLSPGLYLLLVKNNEEMMKVKVVVAK